MNTHDDEWTVSHDNRPAATVTLTKPQTRFEILRAALWASAGRIVATVGVLLVLGTFFDASDWALALIALIGAGVVLAYGIRDTRRSEVWRS